MIARFLVVLSIVCGFCVNAADSQKDDVSFPVHLKKFQELFSTLGYDVKSSKYMGKAILRLSKVFSRTSIPADSSNSTVQSAAGILKKLQDEGDSNKLPGFSVVQSELDDFLYETVRKSHGTYKGYGRSREDFFADLDE